MTPAELTELAREIALAAGLREAGEACGCDRSTDAAPKGSHKDRRPQASGVAALIDQTLLRPDATEAEVLNFLRASRRAGFCSVCVQPMWVAAAVREMHDVSTKVSTVVGFPHGAGVTPVKRLEAETAIRLGAAEIDMVANIAALKSGNLDAAYADIKAVAEVTRRYDARLKVILEMPRLSERQKINACVVAKLAGADFVKTSTGFDDAVASVGDVELMHRVVGGALGVKAAGGIRSYSDLSRMASAGATRIGTSRGLEILRDIGR